MSKFRRQLMMASMGEPVPPTPPLPYDAEVEYLEGTGTQYIDTGVNMRQLVDATYKIRLRSVSGIQALFGVYTDNNDDARGQIYINKNVWKDASSNNLHTDGFSGNATTSQDYTLHSWTILTKSNDWSFFIFARNNDSSSYLPTKMRLYYLQITVGGSLFRDYIPVRVGTVGYLYDRVSGQLFGNAGTGNFIIGNDKN